MRHLQCTSAQQIRLTQRQSIAHPLHLCTTETEPRITGTTGFPAFACAGHSFNVQHHNTMKPFTMADIFHSLDCEGLAKTIALYDLAQHTKVLQQILKVQDEIEAVEEQHNSLSEQLGELEAQLAAAGVGQ